MLAFPPLFPTNYGWPSDDFIPKDIQLDCHDSVPVEPNLYNSVLDFPTYDDIQSDLPPENSNSSGGIANGDFADPLSVVKKLNHNASERHRRKRVNDLYAFLRSVLPISGDQKKKVSIPGTVSRALKYIPELQKEVATLIRKKEKLSLDSSSKDYLRKQGVKKKIGNDAKTETKSSVVSSVSVLGANEAVIQLISSNEDMKKRKEIGFLSRVLEYLEQEEDELVLMNATTFECAGEETSFSTLHLQMQGDNSIDAERLKEKLCSFHQQLDPVIL